MPEYLPFDVFLSHSSKDKAVVHELAERLRGDGVRVWFDEWELRPGDSVPAKIEEGLERSRILLLFMSVNAFGSDWAQLEAGTFRFKDPLNKERRFVPVRLDDAEIKGSLGQFLYVDWRAEARDGEYRKLLNACKPERVKVELAERGPEVRVVSLGHTDSVRSVAWSPDGRRALSGSLDNTVRVWEVESGRTLSVLEGHTDRVWSVAWSPDGRRALSGSYDHTVRVWEVESGRTLGVLEGHSNSVFSVAWSPDGRRAYSASANGVMRIWDLTSALAADAGVEEQIEYANAKVLLVGESGVGKTGLSMRLAKNDWKPSESTLGAWATQWPMRASGSAEREIWLWDFGGQADQRLIHQLYMEDTAAAVLVFDAQKNDAFEALGQWDRDITRASRRPFVKMLAAGRVDVGGLRMSRGEMETFAKDRGFVTPVFETSAKTGEGCEALKDGILSAIDWDKIAWRTSPKLFKRLKDGIVRLKDAGRVLMRANDLREVLLLTLAGEGVQFSDDEFKGVLGLLASPGVVWQLEFGSWVLLQPEWVNAYAQAVIQTLRTDEDERGCILEDKVLGGELSYPPELKRLPAEDEKFVLLGMHQTLLQRGLCLREPTDQGTLLIFPSYYRRERPELVGHPAVLVTYRFSGFLDDIYATLVVRLHHTQAFEHDKLWRYAADFKTLGGKQLVIKLTRKAEGAGELDVYFDPLIADEQKIIFARYVHEHLGEKAQEVVRLRHYVCGHCGTAVGNREVAMEKLNAWLAGKKADAAAVGRGRKGASGGTVPTVVCIRCEKRVALWDDLERRFASEEVRRRVNELEGASAAGLDSESKERVLVGEVISTVALAGQICREFSVSDHGIDMEVEFRRDDGEASGRKVYFDWRQLKRPANDN